MTSLDSMILIKEKIMILNTKNVKYLIIHCSDTVNTLRAIDIHKMHLGFGWNGIGYHKVICKSGIVESGRPEYWVGAHTKGKNNESLGVCLVGKNKFTKKQFESLKKILLEGKENYPDAIIQGHRDAIETHKTCPNFDVNRWCLENLK